MIALCSQGFRKGIDAFPEANARTLIRRLNFDLIGLPPTPEEVRAFVRNSKTDRDGTYAKLVERLLDSPRYGEQWARHWLDVARYGESHGYDKDKARFNAWPYRDYVIRSFNDDKPWTQFVREQVAGDVLYPKEPDGVVAMGFVAAGPWDFIAHHEVGEGKLDGRIAKHLDRDDMVSAVFNAFMSTTVQCAQCHNHKFDPVSMTDYYRLHTIFAAVDRRDRVYDLDPAIAKQRVKFESEIADLEKQLRGIDKAIEAAGGAELKTIKARVAELKKGGEASLNYVPEHGYHSQIVKQSNIEKWVQLELPESARFTKVLAGLLRRFCRHPWRLWFSGAVQGGGFRRSEVCQERAYDCGSNAAGCSQSGTGSNGSARWRRSIHSCHGHETGGAKE